MTEAEADAVFHALADATRRDIVRRAVRQESSISALAVRYAMSFAAVQKHVAVLERSGLIAKERRGKEQIVRANLETIARANRLLGEFEAIWRDRAQRIEDLLEGDGAEAAPDAPDAPDAVRAADAPDAPVQPNGSNTKGQEA